MKGGLGVSKRLDGFLNFTGRIVNRDARVSLFPTLGNALGRTPERAAPGRRVPPGRPDSGEFPVFSL